MVVERLNHNKVLHLRIEEWNLKSFVSVHICIRFSDCHFVFEFLGIYNYISNIMELARSNSHILTSTVFGDIRMNLFSIYVELVMKIYEILHIKSCKRDRM